MADRELEHLRVGHEQKDVNAIAVTKFGIGLSLIIILSLFGLWGLFHYFAQVEEVSPGAAGSVPLEQVSIPKMPPEPRLQSTPKMDLSDMRAAEDQLLHHYSWVDRDKGVVRLPIDRAMDILAQRGLPSRPAEGQPQGITK
jgi:hypothetical protein